MRNLIPVLALSFLVAAAAAQEPTGAPEVTDTGPPAVTVETVAPEPTEPTPAAVQEAVEEREEKSVEAMAEGETTLPEVSRDPAETIDSGEGGTFWLLALLFGSIWSPIIAIVVEKVKAIDSRLGQPIAGLGLVVFYLTAWALLAPGNPGLPQEWQAWLGAAFMGAGAGAMSSGGVRSFRSRA